jgi:hypothetical protein
MCRNVYILQFTEIPYSVSERVITTVYRSYLTVFGNVYILQCTEGTLQCVGMCNYCSVQRVSNSMSECVHIAIYRGYPTVCENVYMLRFT